jgi:hypothetical protein
MAIVAGFDVHRAQITLSSQVVATPAIIPRSM